MKNIFRLLIVIVILTSLLSLGIVTASAQGSSITHTVQIGETLSHIAVRYGTTVQALSAVNNIPYPYWIYFGQQIVIPATGGPIPPVTPGPISSSYHVVRQGENLFRIGLNYGWDVNTMAAANGLFYPYTIYPGQVLVVPRQSLTHVVRQGETVGSLALMYGTTMNAIVTANGLVNPNLIYIGQTLIIP